MALIEFETRHLQLRQWRLADRQPFAELNADVRVMQYFPAPLTREQSDLMADRCASLIEKQGWGLWAVEYKPTQDFIGFVGLHRPTAALPFSPCIEIGWRLAFRYWGKGLAYEAARAALHTGFTRLDLPEIVSFTAIGNVRSRALMGRIGMHECGTFEHPEVPAGTELRQHWLYRIRKHEFLACP